MIYKAEKIVPYANDEASKTKQIEQMFDEIRNEEFIDSVFQVKI